MRKLKYKSPDLFAVIRMAPGKSELLDYFLVPAGKLLLTKDGRNSVFGAAFDQSPTGKPGRGPAYPNPRPFDRFHCTCSQRESRCTLLVHALIDASLRKRASASLQRASRTSIWGQSGLKPATSYAACQNCVREFGGGSA